MIDDIITKRLNYFDHQFLQENDFKDEQKYYLNRRYLHYRLLHTPGIAEGLEVKKTGDKKIKITPGIAINIRGQEIVSLEEVSLDFNNASTYPPNTDIYITIEYKEEATEPQPAEKPIGYTRCTEKSVVRASIDRPGSRVIQLAKFKLDQNGNVPDKVGQTSDDGRKFVGSVIPNDSISFNKFKKVLKEINVTILGNATKLIWAFDQETRGSKSAFLLVFIYSNDNGANFKWYIQYKTDNDLKTIQEVYVENSASRSITILGNIYAILEN